MTIAMGRVVAAGMLLGACQGASAWGKEQAGFDAASSTALKDVPVEIVLLNDHLRAQMSYQDVSIDPSIVQQATLNAFGPAAYTTGGIAAGAAGGAIASFLIDSQMQLAAENIARPAYGTIKAAQCDLSVSDDVIRSIETSVKNSSWGSSAVINHHVLSERQDLSDVVAEDSPRYVLGVSYSLSPDFSTVMTTVNAMAYAPSIPGAPEHWQKKPAWSDQLIILSNRLTLEPKTDADIEHAIAAENARYAASDANALVAKANAGDDVARRHAVPLVAEYSRLMHDAKSKQWSPTSEAVRRSELWSENQCGRLKDALQANNTDLTQMLTQMFAGQLPPRAPAKPFINVNSQLDSETVGERRTFAVPGNMYILRRGGDFVPLDFRYSWFPEAKADKKS